MAEHQLTKNNAPNISIEGSNDQVIHFEQLQQNYLPGQDIKLTYHVDKQYTPSNQDWVGLFRTNWKHLHDCIAFQRAPREKSFGHRTIIFPGRDLVDKSTVCQYYQFMYINKSSKIIGISQIIHIPGALAKAMITEDDFEHLSGESDLDESSYDLIASQSKRVSDPIVEIEMPSPEDEPMEEIKAPDLDAQAKSDFIKSKSDDSIWNVVDPKCKPDLDSLCTSSNKSMVTVHTKSSVLKPLKESRTESVYTSRHHIPGYVPSQLSGNLRSPRSGAHCVPLTHSMHTNTSKLWHSGSLCNECISQKHQVDKLKDECEYRLAELNTYKQQLIEAQDSLSLKDLLVDNLSQQVKHLVHDNTDLNTKLNLEQQADSKDHIQRLQQRNASLCANTSKLRREVKVLKRESLLAKDQNMTMEGILNMHKQESQSLQHKVESLESQIKMLNTDHQELEEFLDNIMYTLSVKGFAEMVDTKGQAIDLKNRRGKVVELEGWTMCNNKKTDKYLQTIAARDSTISRIRSEGVKLMDTIKLKEGEVHELQRKYKEESKLKEELLEKVSHLTGQITDLSDKIQCLAHQLNTERKAKQEMQQDFRERESSMQIRIQSLHDLVKSTQLLRKCSQANREYGQSSSSSPARSKRDLEQHSSQESNLPDIVNTKSSLINAQPKGPDHGVRYRDKARSKRDLEAPDPSTELTSTTAIALPQQRSSMVAYGKNPYLTNDKLQELCINAKRVEFDSMSDPQQCDVKESVVSPKKGKKRHHQDDPLPPEAFFGAGKSAETPTAHRSNTKAERKKPRKFLMKVNNGGAEQATNAVSYTPRLFGQKPRENRVVNEPPKRFCPQCKTAFHPSLSEAQVESHIQMHKKYSNS